jgi:tetratricopeptide (TPR) repeat protein
MNRIAGLAAALLLIIPLVGLAQNETLEEFALSVDFGRRFFDSGNHSAALGFFEKADSLVRDQPGVLVNMALVLVKLKRYDEAQQRLQRYFHLYSGGPEASTAQALSREIQFAIEVRTRRRNEIEYQSLFTKARFLAQEGSLRAALEGFEAAQQIFTDDPPLLFNQAVIHEALGDYQKATEMYRRYLTSGPVERQTVEAKIFELEREIVDMRTRLMCTFCGEKLAPGARWCHRCWHGPYDISAEGWNSRACAGGLRVTRTLFGAQGPIKSEQLPCLYDASSIRDLLQYHPNRRQAVRDQRRREGWQVSQNGWLDSRSSESGDQLKMVQGEYLEALHLPPDGEVIPFQAALSDDYIWLLQQEPFASDDVLFWKSYGYDENGSIVRESATWESAECRHAINLDAEWKVGPTGVESGSIRGGYKGYRPEGYPATDWRISVQRKIDEQGRLRSDTLVVDSFQKTLAAKPTGHTAAALRRIYPRLRAKRPFDLLTDGDACGTKGTMRIEEPIDLRALYVHFPALAMKLPPGVARVIVDYEYPE